MSLVARTREGLPVLLLLLYLLGAMGVGAVARAFARPPVAAADRAVVDAGWAAALFVLSIPVLHEGLHLLLYRVAGCRGWMGRGRTGIKHLQLFVASEDPVARQLLRVQLWLVPWVA